MSAMPMNEITHLEQLDPNGSYTYSDYLLWKFKERVEIIKGKIMAMSPAPTPLHQQLSMALSFEFRKAFLGCSCRPYAAPFDVRFPDEKGNIKDVVQPDLCVICDESKIDQRGCLGAPDLVVEILSPSNARQEMRYKYELYQQYGVSEYWIIYPEQRTLHIYVLEDGIYKAIQPLSDGDVVRSEKFPMISFNLSDIYT